MEEETEDQILARALEESLRHYKEVELPRLSQLPKETECIVTDYSEYETGGVDDADYWEEWDEIHIENAVQVEESVVRRENFKDSALSNKIAPKTCKNSSTRPINEYMHQNAVPNQSKTSVGEVGIDGADGFDEEAGRTWIYPCGPQIRKYQLDIVQSALFDNTLVCLPTGLGKTFIAAVVMYNFYRWFPTGKIIFLAPTRPLVAQQVHACYSIMGLPKEDTVELTGSKCGTSRVKEWREKRVFFATPQVLANDLGTGICPGELVRCVVVDEAHRAAGNHAICQAIRGLLRIRENSPGSRFRIVALSATPGKNIPAVASVVSTLQISKLELRDESSPDVALFTHHRDIETVVVPLGQALIETRDRFVVILDTFASRLTNRNLLYCQQTSKLNRFQVLTARENFRKNPPPRMDSSQKGLIEGDFAVCITLTYALGLLLTHGQRTFMSFLQGILNGDRGAAVVRNRLSNNIPLLSLLSDLKDRLGESYSMPQPAPDVSLSTDMAAAVKSGDNRIDFITSHPKMDCLRDIVTQHFEKFRASNESTRVMIFCEFRDPVIEICNMLMHLWPLVKPMSFIGQSTSGGHIDANAAGPSKGTKGFTQKQQLKVLEGFRDGGYNVLVSTSVGEEGLDIGEVDLIVCYDAPHASPLRLIQRMGRTGRKREGRVVTLVTKDLEEQKHKMGLRQKNSIVKSIMSSKILATSLCRRNARILPPGTRPSCHMMPIIIPKSNDEVEKSTKKGPNKKRKNKDIPSMMKKGRKKAKGENDIDVADEPNERIGGVEGRKPGGVDSEPGPSKSKGRGKSSKRNPLAASKKPKKGIKEFFSIPKAKVLNSFVESENEVEDDDFVGHMSDKIASKCLEPSKEIVIIDDDDDTSTGLKSTITQTADSNGPSMAKQEKELSSLRKMNLPPSLLALEDGVVELLENSCCVGSSIESPYKCSIISSFFQLNNAPFKRPQICSFVSLDFITVDALCELNVEKEAKSAILWEKNSHIHSAAKDFGLWTKSVASSSCLGKLAESSNVNVEKKCIKNEKKETLEISDDEEGGCESNGMWPKMDASGPAIETSIHVPPREVLLWNVCGKVLTDAVDVKAEKHKPNPDKCLLLNAMKPPSAGSVSGAASPSKPPFKQEAPTDVDPISCKNKCASSNSYECVTSPDILDEKYSHFSPPKTPTKGFLQPILSHETQNRCVSHADMEQRCMALASSTPKMHRINIFSPNSCLPSPIGCASKKPADPNFDLLPENEDFLDEIAVLQCDSKILLHKEVLASSPHRNTPTVPQPNSVNIQMSKKKFCYELPNFDLGSEYHFSSDSSDETIFEGEEYNKDDLDNLIAEDFTKDGLAVGSSMGEHHASNQFLEQGPLGMKIDKSKDIFENSSKDPVPSSLLEKIKSQFGKSFSNFHDQSFTVTQIMNLISSPETSSKGVENANERVLPDQNRSTKTSDIPCVQRFEKFDSFDGNAKSGVQMEVKEIITAGESSYSPTKKIKISSVDGENGTEVASSVLNGEINFDLGDEFLLDVSADLFAEDDTERWLSESQEKKEELMEKGDPMKPTHHFVCKSPLGSSKIKGEFHSDVKSSKNNDPPRTDHMCPGNSICSDAEKVTVATSGSISTLQGPKEVFKTTNVVISGWNTDVRLSKAAPSSKRKLNLGLKSNVNHIDSELATKITNLNQKNLVQACDGSNWIDDIGREERALEAIVSHKIQNDKEHMLIKSEVLSDSVGSISSLEFDDFDLSGDLIGLLNEPRDDEIHGLTKNTDRDAFGRETKVCVEGAPTKNHQYSLKSNDGDESEYLAKNESKMKKHIDPLNSQEKSILNLTAIHFSKESDESTDRNVNDLNFHMKYGKRMNVGKIESSETGVESDSNVDLNGCDVQVHKEYQQSESSDDFESQNTKKGGKNKIIAGNDSKEISISSEEKPPVRLRRKRGKRRCVFLDTQAEESFVEAGLAKKLSSDDDDDDKKGLSQYYDPSFINDDCRNSQEIEVDMLAKYLQSVRSPRNAKFKIPNLPVLAAESDQLNQPSLQSEFDSCYMNDSFCVEGDSESDGTKVDSIDELEVMEAILSRDAKEKRNQKKRKREVYRAPTDDEDDEDLVVLESKRPKKSEIETVAKGNKRKRKRILVHDSSEEEDHSEHVKVPPKNSSDGNENYVVDEVLLEESSQDFEESHVETHAMGQKGNRKGFDCIKNVGRSSGKENENIQGHSNRISHYFSKLSKKRVSELRTECAEVGRMSTIKNSCDNEQVSGGIQTSCGQFVSKNEKGKNSFLGLKDKLISNWSSDLFELSDDEEVFAKVESTTNAHHSGISRPSVSTKTDPIAVVSPLGLPPCLQKDEPRVPPESIGAGIRNGSCSSSTITCSAGKMNASKIDVRNSNNLKPNSTSRDPSFPKLKDSSATAQSVDYPQPSSSRSATVPSNSACDSDPKDLGDTKTIIVVSPVEACRAAEVMSALRTDRRVRLVVFASGGSPSIPYGLGRNLCLFRVSISDLGRGPKVPDMLQVASGLYQKVFVVIECGSEEDSSGGSGWNKKRSINIWSNHSAPAKLSTAAHAAIINFRGAGVNVLYSWGRVETANLIADVARHNQALELKSGLQPLVLPSSFESSDPRLKFYSSLPGINTFQALCLLVKFPKISDLLEKCSTVRLIQNATALDVNKSLDLHKILANVHISDS